MRGHTHTHTHTMKNRIPISAEFMAIVMGHGLTRSYPEPAGSKFPRRERALGGNPQAHTPTNNATSRLGGRAPKRRSLWGMLVQESFHPQLISTDMSDKHKLLFQTINNIQKMKWLMITTV
jgi:hypothetical protein